MSLFKLVEKERDAFYGWTGDGRHAHPRSILRDIVSDRATHLLPEAYRFSRCVDKQVTTNARDRGEIVNHWLEYDEYYDHYPKKPLVTLNDARKSVMRIDDGRISSDTRDPKSSRHPVWHKPIIILIRDWK